MSKPGIFIILIVFLTLILAAPAGAQEAQEVLPGEPTTEAFIAENFHLQNEYSGVRCVSQDGTCPEVIKATVPCVVAECDHPSVDYEVNTTYDTIQQASDEAQPGELIVITPGRYAGVVVESMGGAEEGYIHFLGLGEIGDVVVDSVSDPDAGWQRHLFYFVDAHHYIIENITFASAEDGAGIFFTGYFSATGEFSDHMIVSNVYAHDNYEWGMHTTSTNYIVVQDSVFTNSEDEHGIYISGSGDNVVLRRNILQGNNASGIQVNADPQSATGEVFYWLQNSTGDTCGITEDEVWSGGTWEDVKACYDEQGLPDLGEFFEDGISENIRIENNIITGNGSAGGAGINLASVKNSIVRNNLIYGNDAAAIACWDNGYTEEKGLFESNFGCSVVEILENSMIDETGGRGSLIITNDAHDNYVINNIIIRGDRDDAYEITGYSGVGLNSYGNYYSAQLIDNSPGFSGDTGSTTGFTVEEALAQFVNPNFEPWILEDGDTYTLNPDRPDFHPIAGTVLGGGRVMPAGSDYDLFGEPRGNEIGALTAVD